MTLMIETIEGKSLGEIKEKIETFINQPNVKLVSLSHSYSEGRGSWGSSFILNRITALIVYKII